MNINLEKEGKWGIPQFNSVIAVFSKSYFSFDYPVHDCLHRFHPVALHHSFKVLRAMF